MTDFEMFTAEGNTRVNSLLEEAVSFVSVDGPHNPVESAWNWLLNELDALGEQPGFEEATDTAVREACWEQFVS
jgi:hypothetical protein